MNLLQGAALFTAMAHSYEKGVHGALEKAAVIVKTESKRVIGTYDYGWPPLAASTLAKKVADTPLLETGEMRDSIQHEVQKTSAFVGTDSDKAVWQELGTKKIPPRPFLMGAAMHKKDEVGKALGQELTRPLLRSP